MYTAYKNGRSEKDPSVGWYEGEIWFFDNYVVSEGVTAAAFLKFKPNISYLIVAPFLLLRFHLRRSFANVKSSEFPAMNS